MKWFLCLCISVTFFNCTNNKEGKTEYYMATSKGMVSFLSLNEKENRFYGEYEIRHQGNAKEYGKVKGEKIGDTLKGRLDYISYGGSRKIVPFLLLKKGNHFKLATGLTATFMGIPYYIPETIQFNDSSFQFKPITSRVARNYGLIIAKDLN